MTSSAAATSLLVSLSLVACGGSDAIRAGSSAGGVGTSSHAVASGVTTSSSVSASSGVGGASASTSAGAGGSAADHGYPLVVNGGAPVLSPLRVVTIVASGDPLATQLFDFGDAILASSWFSTVGAEWGLSAGTNVNVTGAAIPSGTVLDEAAQEAYIQQSIASAPNPPMPDGHTVYVLYLPPNVVYNFNGATNSSCQLASGYHLPFGTLGDGFAILQQCLGTFASITEELEIVGSHEIGEAATDTVQPDGWVVAVPDGAQPWTVSPFAEFEGIGFVEIGDPCIGTKHTEGSFAYQRMYSNAAIQKGGDPCVPALPIPYFSVDAAVGWTKVTAGQTLEITLEGWSTGTTGDWVVSPFYAAASGPNLVDPGVHVESATMPTIAGKTWATVNAGREVKLVVDVPTTMASGDWIVVGTYSFHLDAMGFVPAGEDYGHQMVVGVYIP